jgi:tRNA threonylcarbamoyladenosine biosynthesis protein TsaB
MVLLAIDTAGPDCAVAVAIVSDGVPRIVAHETERVGRGHSEIIMPMIERALRAGGCGYPELDRIAVTVGPGSFTGIRAGIATARGLALALDIPAVGVGVLDALLESPLSGGAQGPIIAALDARRGQIFAAGADGATGEPLFQPLADDPEQVAGRVRAMVGTAPVRLTGSGSTLLAAALSRSGVEAEVVDAAESADIAAVVQLGASATPGASPSPLYLRGADAKAQTGKAVARR